MGVSDVLACLLLLLSFESYSVSICIGSIDDFLQFSIVQHFSMIFEEQDDRGLLCKAANLVQCGNIKLDTLLSGSLSNVCVCSSHFL